MITRIEYKRQVIKATKSNQLLVNFPWSEINRLEDIAGALEIDVGKITGWSPSIEHQEIVFTLKQEVKRLWI